MARRRLEFSSQIEHAIAIRTARGESAETIKAAVPGAPSIATIERRQRELRDKVSGSSAGRNAASKPADEGSSPSGSAVDIPDDVPAGTPLEQLDKWIARCESGARTAEKDGNLGAMASLAAKAATLMALRHKATPLPKPDPSENPDFVALAKQGRYRLEKLARGIFAGT